jgi:hypothetical protein
MTELNERSRTTAAIGLTAAVCKPRNFLMNEVPARPGIAPEPVARKVPALGPLEAFKGTFTGHGFNVIFRPQNKATPTALPVPQPDSDNVLELNLTAETLSFSASLGAVPNRGEAQGDVFLNGVPYLQSINDVTDPVVATSIHFEPGLWMIVPPTADPSETQPTLARMASIPHGTTVNAQGTFFTVKSGPRIDPVDITPFKAGDPSARIRFPSQTVTDSATARIPQDLSVAPSITQQLLDDPNTLLRQHIDGLTIFSTDVIQIDTQSTLVGGGTGNIGFLTGDAKGPNAAAIQMSAIFWIEEVHLTIDVGPMKAGATQIVAPSMPGGAPQPTFAVRAGSANEEKRSVTASYRQIQYSQTVSLNFANLTWPHVSVATLVPADPITVQL